AQRGCGQCGLAAEAGDEARLDLGLGVGDLRGEVVGDERAVNAGAAGDDGGLQVVVAALLGDLGDDGLDALVLVAVDLALGVAHAVGRVAHRAVPSARGATGDGSGVKAGGVNVGSGLRVAATCSTPMVPSIRARVARSSRKR